MSNPTNQDKQCLLASENAACFAQTPQILRQLEKATQWLQNLRNAGHTDLLINTQPPHTGLHHFYATIAEARAESLEETLKRFDLRIKRRQP
jgi:hypothetical protein